MFDGQSNAKAHQRRQNHQQRDDFAANVHLLEAEDAVDERHDEAHTVKDERDEHHHGGLLLQARKVDDVGHGDEESHRHDAPTPLERLLLTFREPDNEKQHGHHQEVVDGIPSLYGGRRNAFLQPGF